MERARLPACINCGVPLPQDARYCGRCGQDHRHPKLRLRELVRDAASEALSFDRPWLATLRGLFPETGTMARAYADGHRVGLVAPVRFLLTSLAFQFLVLESADALTGVSPSVHPGWISAGLLLFSLPLAQILRLFCGARDRDVAEAIVFACYAMGMTALFTAIWFGGARGMVLFAGSRGWSLPLQLFPPVTLVLLGVGLPLYWSAGLARFFACPWRRAAFSAYVGGAAGLACVAALLGTLAR
jgi:hypothetical protein